METNPRLPYVMGVKRSCILNSLQYFNTCENFSVDIMHDILEGVAQFEMKLLILHVIDRYTTSKEVDRRIKSFNYGYMEQNNKPPTVKLGEDSNDLGLNAIQSWCLLCNLPLIFGDLVCPNDQHWYLLLLLLQIVNIVFSPVLSKGITIFLKHLIAEHHRLFKHLCHMAVGTGFIDYLLYILRVFAWFYSPVCFKFLFTACFRNVPLPVNAP